MTELSNQKDGFCTAFFMLLVALCVISWYHWLVKKPNKVNPPLPPGPSVIQQVGDLFSLRRDPISYLDKLSKRYGPIIKFKYGARLCIVISSASVAKEVFKDHDTIFANHDDSVVAYAGTWGGTDLGWAPHGEDWRMLRKICALEFLNFSRLDALYYHRRREVRSMVSQLYSNSCNSINIGDYIFSSMFNGVTNMLWGGTLEGEEMKHFNAEVLEALENFLALLNSLNISDLFPVLAVLDIQGLATRMKKINTWFDKKFNFIIGRSLDKKDQKETKDFLQALLHVKECGDQKSSFSTTHIKGLLMVISAHFCFHIFLFFCASL
ncbi:hypothetical protein IFM89_011749 [Coptis chinensis]|uniref:Cytochrome P450 n=1 Tax=Coptis chinensis TaxID=261450 RepID=A0A835IMC7_9MAGN|nr:hypothetical protein IFM89_011749 [Coptis chinensis]